MLGIRPRAKQGEMKKVIMLFSMSFLPYQGRYLRVYNEARTLVEAGKDVTIIAWDRDCREPRAQVIDGIKVERIWRRAGFQRGPYNVFSVLAFNLHVFVKLLRKGPDVIHCFNLDTILAGLLAARTTGKKAVLDLCEPDYYANWPRRYRPLVRLVERFEQIFSRRFDYLLVHNLYQVRKFRRYGIRAMEHIGSYPNRSLIVDKIKDKKGADGTVVIGRFGSIYKNNGIEEMMEAFKRVTTVVPKVRLMLSGKVFEEFQKVFDGLALPLGDAVHITGAFSPNELPGLYEQIDISLQLTRRTDWFRNITPTKFFESLANGVPVVTSDIGDLREIIEECQCGVIVDETDPESVFLALKKLVEDPGLRLEMANNGLQAVKERYNWNLMGQKLLKVYEALEPVKLEAYGPTPPEVKQF